MSFGMKLSKERICLYSSFTPEISSARLIIDGAARHGLGGVELMSFCEELATPDINIARELGREARSHGLKLPCFSVGINLIENCEENLSRLRGYADICSELQIPYLHHTIALDFVSGDISEEVREERFKLGAELALSIMDYARPLGVKTLIEDQGFVFNGVENCRRLCELSGGGIGLVADVGNILFWGERPEDFIRAMGKDICHAHLKDLLVADAPDESGAWYPARNGKFLREVQIGHGCTDYTELNRAFQEIDYRGMFALEFPCGTDENAAHRAIKLLTEGVYQ